MKDSKPSKIFTRRPTAATAATTTATTASAAAPSAPSAPSSAPSTAATPVTPTPSSETADSPPEPITTTTTTTILGDREPEKAYCSVVKRVKSANVTPQNIGEIVLCQIPTVGPETAIAIMQKFNQSLPQLIHALETQGKTCLEGITTLDTNKGNTRKISKACIENIHRFLL
jgi:hypothetical protein